MNIKLIKEKLEIVKWFKKKYKPSYMFWEFLLIHESFTASELLNQMRWDLKENKKVIRYLLADRLIKKTPAGYVKFSYFANFLTYVIAED